MSWSARDLDTLSTSTRTLKTRGRGGVHQVYSYPGFCNSKFTKKRFLYRCAVCDARSSPRGRCGARDGVSTAQAWPLPILESMIVLLKLLKPRLMADEYSAGLGGEDEPVVGADDADSESPADEAEEAAVDDGDDEAGDVEVPFVNVTPIAEDAEGAG